MISSYELAELAVADLKEIWEYIAERNPEAADKLLDEFAEKFQLLAENPTIGRNQSGYIIGMRNFPYRKYIIYYFPVENGVEIYRVFHAARNIRDLFEDFFEGLKP